ncbi:MAG: PLDc N-terminal domain-containing protein [Planctomycetota bacterium]
MDGHMFDANQKSGRSRWCLRAALAIVMLVACVSLVVLFHGVAIYLARFEGPEYYRALDAIPGVLLALPGIVATLVVLVTLCDLVWYSRHRPKAPWLLSIIFLNVLGVLAYWIVEMRRMLRQE